MESDNVAPKQMNKERIVKEDGRYLIYFSIETAEPDKDAQAKDHITNSATSTGEQPNV